MLLMLFLRSGCFLGLSVIEGGLESTEALVEIHKNVGSADLNQRIISSFEKNYVLFVKVAKETVAHHLVDNFPVARYQALLVQVDIVALDNFGHTPLRVVVVLLMQFSPLIDQVVSDLIPVDPLERVAKSLQTLRFSLP